MKILVSCLSKSWGGMEMVTLIFIKKLLERNINIEFLCIMESRLHIEANSLGIIINPIKAGGYFHPNSILKVTVLIRNKKYDLIHTHASKDLWLIVPALKILRSRIPLLLTKHVGSFIIKKDKLHKYIYNRVTFALAISKVIAKNLFETCPLPKEKILIHHNGVDLKKFNVSEIDSTKMREELKIKKNEMVLGMMARFSPGKGHEEFLFAANELNKKYENLKFLIVGEPSRGENDFAESIKNLAKDYNLKNLIFTGYRTDIPQMLSAMDIFVFPSHSEAFGIALIEAMAMKVPSVCSNSDGILDIAVDGETSYLFERRNGNDLLEKLSLLINSEEARNNFSEASRKRVEKFFDIENIIDQLIDIYNRSLKPLTNKL